MEPVTLVEKIEIENPVGRCTIEISIESLEIPPRISPEELEKIKLIMEEPMNKLLTKYGSKYPHLKVYVE